MSVAWNQRRRNAAIMAAVGAAMGASLSSSAFAVNTPYYWSDNNNDHLWDSSTSTFGSNWAQPAPGTNPAAWIGDGNSAHTYRGVAPGDFPNAATSDAYFIAGNVNTNVNLHGATFTVGKLQFGRDVPVDTLYTGDTYKIGGGRQPRPDQLQPDRVRPGRGRGRPAGHRLGH